MKYVCMIIALLLSVQCALADVLLPETITDGIQVTASGYPGTYPVDDWTNMTVCFWCYINDWDWSGFFNQGDYNHRGVSVLERGASDRRIWVHVYRTDGNEGWKTPQDPVTLGVWFHLAFTVHVANLDSKIWINGSDVTILDTAKAGTMKKTAGDEIMYFGNYSYNNTLRATLDGGICDIRFFFNRVLTDADVLRIYRSQHRLDGVIRAMRVHASLPRYMDDESVPDWTPMIDLTGHISPGWLTTRTNNKKEASVVREMRMLMY